MRLRYAAWGLCLTVLPLSAQTSVIELLVLDSLEGTPLEAVSVAWTDGTRAMAQLTDPHGRCAIAWPGSGPLELRLARAGYRPRSMGLDPDDARGRRPFTVYLAALELPAVEVVRKPEVVFERPDLHAADLLINDDGIWVLAYEHPRLLRAEVDAGKEILRGVRLVLLDTNFREWASCPLPEDVLGLRRDLRNTALVEGVSRAFAIHRAGDHLELEPFGLEDLRSKVLPWTDSIGGRILGNNSDGVMPAFDHLAYDPVNDTTRVVCTVMDTFMMALFRSEYRQLRGPEKVLAMNLASELGVDEETVAGYMSGFQHNIWFKPVYAPLFVAGDTLLVFDHASARLRKFTRGLVETASVPLPYLAEQGGRYRPMSIIQDRADGKLFALFQHNGIQWVRPIDPVSGALGLRVRLTFRYPERTQVYGGHVYYVYRPVESLQKRTIYRERL